MLNDAEDMANGVGADLSGQLEKLLSGQFGALIHRSTSTVV